jgi:hypothetical protein
VGTYVTRAVKDIADSKNPGPVELSITAKVGQNTEHVATVVVGRIDNLKK